MSDASADRGVSAKLRAVLRAVPRSVLVGAATVLVLLVGFVLLRSLSTADVRVSGAGGDGPVTREAVQQIRVHTADSASAVVLLDGRPVPTREQDGAIGLRPGELSDGEHELSVQVPRSPSWLGTSSTEHRFTVDGEPPVLRVADSLRPQRPGEPVTVEGTAQGAERVEVAGNAVPTAPDGSFSSVVQNPDREVRVTAVDAAGNRAEQMMTVHVRHPGMRAVHMTGLAWTSDTLREPVLEMARQGRIDTVELDIKDESGEVPYDSRVPLANRIGAVKNYYDAKQSIDQLHSMGVRVVGRLVAFKDPILGESSWRAGHPERVVQTSDGQPWSTGGYGSFAFTNFADPVVRQYNIDIAAEAVELGFDDILYDYVRRPDGDIGEMRLPGLQTTPEASVAGFLRETQPEVRSRGALLGASVFGIAVDRPTEIAQDIRQMSQFVDYIAPMVYPSHWAPGEFDVDNPDAQPFDIVQRSLAVFADIVRGTDVQIIPWLQDFSLGAEYGPEEVRAQIDAAASNDMDSFLLWAANCRYTGEALTPQG
ncbi:putative glycoside hydrolase [Saccharopolyspora sp. HNM0983]|uniref:Glycoside hydrolase n=1 Tax=Saccharopolyspora montiporae TaxID=2781240 RepID=A0A929B8M0_9PSEU|nr:putative glycoside hydrolase [Saccharopolyspora sp. HNM0983]MBE9373436.1 putative glycoside hydrolase [Saccharopolyspora sp. HNM0983]